MTIQVDSYADLASFSREHWESLAHASIYQSYGWLRARSATIVGPAHFLLASDASGKALAAVPSYLTDQRSHPSYDPARALAMDDIDDGVIELTTMPEAAAALARLRARLSSQPELLRPALAVSSPGLMGGVSYAPGLGVEARHEAVHALASTLESQAAADAAATVAWLYLIEGADPVIEQVLSERGYTSVVMGADCYLPIVWGSMAAYFAGFQGNRRRTLRQEMSAFARAGVSVKVHGPEALDSELAELELQWRHKYGRHATLAGTLANYQSLREHMGDSFVVVVARQAGKAIGFTTFLDDGTTWWARFGGFDYAATARFLYFNLVFYHPIQAAIERNIRCMAYSRTAYETKHSRGCALRNFLAYVRLGPDSPLLNDLTLVGDLQRRRFARIAAAKR